MAHLLRVWSDGQLSRGLIVVGNDLKALDQNTFVAINGDGGGTWTPAADLNINGAGMVCAGPWTATGAGVTVMAPTFGKLTADDYFGLAGGHAGRSQTLVQIFFDCYSSQPEWVQLALGDVNFIQGLLTTTPGVRFLTPIRVFNGATLETVTVRFAVGITHANVPTQLPQVRVVAIDALGNVLPMGTGAQTDTLGFRAVASPTSGAAWFSGGSSQTFVYTCNANQTIDLSKYSYFLEFIEESGTNCFAPNAGAGNTWIGATSFLDTISLYDGRN